MIARNRRTLGAGALLLALILTGLWWAMRTPPPSDDSAPGRAGGGEARPGGVPSASDAGGGGRGVDEATAPEPRDLFGRVTDRNGIPIANVRLELRGDVAPRVVWSGHDGGYRFAAVDRGTGPRSLHADPTGVGEGFAPRLLEVPPDATRLDPWLRLDGSKPERFVLEVEFGGHDPEGDLLHVFLIGRDGFTWFGATFADRPHDVVEGIPVGTYQVVGRQGSRVAFLPSVRVDPSASPLRVLLEPGESIAGRVVDAAGRPLAGFPLTLRTELVPDRIVYPATLHAILDRRPAANRIVVPATTDLDGRFRFEGLPPALHRIHGRGEEGRLYVGTEVVLARTGAETDLGDLVARPGTARARIRVSLPKGDPRPGEIRLRLLSAYDARREIVVEGDEGDEKEIEVTDLPAGAYVVVVHKVDGPGAYRLTETVRLDVEEGGRHEVTLESVR